MKKSIAFVLGGGGARGALQVGSLRALLEAGIQPAVLVGASIGAANAAFLAVHGANASSVKELVKAWHDAIHADLLPPRYLWLTLRSLFNRPVGYTSHRMRDFLVAHGLNPDLEFGDVQGVRLYTVAADLNSGRTVFFGRDLHQSILEGVLASAALPPWISPKEKDGQLLMDGGVVSNLPIQAALLENVTEIIALDISDGREVPGEPHGFGQFLAKMVFTVGQRQVELEKAMARACDVKVRHVHLFSDLPVPLWDFRCTDDLIVRGYQQTCQAMQGWLQEPQPGLKGWLTRKQGR